MGAERWTIQHDGLEFTVVDRSGDDTPVSQRVGDLDDPDELIAAVASLPGVIVTRVMWVGEAER